MTVRAQILRFLRQPLQFADEPTDKDVWLDGLKFARDSIACNDDHELRPAQVAAWEGMAVARAGLVLGPPGTGKTHLLSWLILGYVHARLEADLPCRVFVSAFTLNAIGNVLDALVRRRDRHWPGGMSVKYLGNPPANGLSSSIDHRRRVDGTNAHDAISDLMSTQCVVVGSSIWSLYRLLESGLAPQPDGLTAELFDLACIDEASQMVLGHGLMALGGLKPGGRVVVAGDSQQLPPVRVTREVTLGERQLGGSLYAFLKSAEVPEFPLNETFRLNGPLASFPERKFYPGNFKSAVPTRTLDMKPQWDEGLEDWERVIIDPQWPLCVLLHDGPPTATNNKLEAEIAVKLAKLLADRMENTRTANGVAPDFWTDRLAIITPHRSQSALINSLLPSELSDGAFVETVDRIQGKERDAVILSYCVADPEFALAEGDFIFSSERLNVAITRARTKLIVLISRRLFEAVPATQDVMDKAEILREFVFSCTHAGDISYRTKEGGEVSVQVRAVGFVEDQPLSEIKPKSLAESQPHEELTTDLVNVLGAVSACALEHERGVATLSRLKQRLAQGDELLRALAALHRLGHISLRLNRGQYGEYWTARPLDPPRSVLARDYDTVRARLEEVVAQTRRGKFSPRYDDVRDRFAWPDDSAYDCLRPVIEQLKGEGLVTFGTWYDHLTLDWVQTVPPPPDTDVVGEVILSDEDFEVLNDLERREASRINFGIFESWTSAAGLADDTGRDRAEVAASLGRLSTNGWLMLAEEGRVRSRMAELAREIRYVKQRFERDDASRRPYLVRSLKLQLRDRDKPERTTPLTRAFEDIAAELSNQSQYAAALRGLSAAVSRLWGNDAAMAAFQARGLSAVVRAWTGEGSKNFVVVADTGSGKTEAAAFPLIAVAAGDRLGGAVGVKAILAYPRVRLATNQAQRLAAYLAALSSEAGMPTLTLGLQIGQVPESFESLHERDREAGWSSAGARQFAFPFFSCPSEGCGGDLLLEHQGGIEGADLLACTRCNWKYAGWIGSKVRLRQAPPDLFLPTTDSLHQWLHDTRYGALFGDDPAFQAPRAILADEIHLYSHVHGAQVGLALRRLAARAELNAGNKRGVIAIGMSATLGQPARAWGRLIGREPVETIRPEQNEKVRNPRGQEYFYFVQPEVESRGQDIAGASTTIQSLMCLAHGMRRRRGLAGGFRSLAFLDSIDKVRRLHGQYEDAEEAKRLAQYRTRFFVDSSTGNARDGCCGEPSGCDAFHDGECWWFAARDKHQQGAAGLTQPGQQLKVAERPIFSGTTGRVEALIKDSDVVFSTSSLEVGYDDPDISLVYQHYAPQNLASFVQRKGRAGRGSDDRPITGVTLSIYSSRDSWWFRKPHDMIEPVGFDPPLNADNHFVRRGQLLACTLDGFARYQYRTGKSVSPTRPSEPAFEGAKDLISKVFGADPWREFENCESLEAFWETAISQAAGPLTYLRDVRSKVAWIPELLFETINLPQLLVETDSDAEPRREDIALTLATAAPGNATRRFDQIQVAWRPPAQGRAPWFVEEDYKRGRRLKPFGDDAAQLLARLPSTARPLLEGLSPEIFRPRTLHLETLGRMHGIGWQSDWVVSDSTPPVCRRDARASQSRRAIDHSSRGALRGFPIVKANSDRSRALLLPDLSRWIEKTEWFAGDSLGGKETGLAMARVYWGADAEVRMASAQEDPAIFSQVFTDGSNNRPMLHGYHVQTEGVRFKLNNNSLNSFIEKQVASLDSDENTRRWHAGQMLRFLVESGAQAAGVNTYEARRGAELMVSAAADPELRKRLLNLLRFWSGEDLALLFEDTRAACLSAHPLLTRRRVARLAQTLSDSGYRDIFEDAVSGAGDAHRFALYLKSAVMHSVATRLRELFVHLGYGDDRQIVMHVELPVQFGGECDGTISICEAGAFGDGTTRAFVGRVKEVVAQWHEGFISRCPNAYEDEAVKRLFDLASHHDEWRSFNPNDPEALRVVQNALGLKTDAAMPSPILRILYGTETIGAQRFAIYDLAASLRRIDLTLTERLRRSPTAWELTSAAVASAQMNPRSPEGQLLAAYAGLEDASQDESLSPEARLADQVFRIHARLCVDGCQACVHQPSDMMSDTLVESSTSRRLLYEFVEG